LYILYQRWNLNPMSALGLNDCKIEVISNKVRIFAVNSFIF
jgi:hypothetical protein